MATSSPASHDDLGLVLPRGAEGKRSSIAFGRAVFADAVRAVSPAAATAIESEGRWHERYPAHIERLVREWARSGEAALAVASAGLAGTHSRLAFADAAGERPLAAALGASTPGWQVATLAGRGDAHPATLEVPYRGQRLAGDALKRQLEDWLQRDVIEPSHAAMVGWVIDHPEACDLSGHRIALLGARAEMGPLAQLARWRAGIVAVDLPKPGIWRDIVARVLAGNATLYAPLRGEGASDADAIAARAGADLLLDLPGIVAWLAESERPLTIGAYAYLDGALHVRVAAAMDAIQAALVERRPGTTLAMLATPTDIYAVPAAAREAAQRRHAAQGIGTRALAALSGGRLCRPNLATEVEAAGVRYAIADAMVVQQGPNYALAKRLQQWRAIEARSRGARVSIHVAPPATTYSVIKNKLLASAYRGARRFGVEAFAPDTAAALMAALLVHDLANPAAPANPAVPLVHPLELINAGANHGGLWRLAWQPRSVLPLAALAGSVGA